MKHGGAALVLCLFVACATQDVELWRGTSDSDAETSCQGDIYPASAAELEILMLLDNSVSMGVLPAVPLSCVASLMLDCPAGDLTRTPWNVAVSELERFVHDERSNGISLSLTYFGDQCASDFYTQPSVPVGQLPAHASAIVNSLYATIPLAGTATRPALEGLLTYAAARSSLSERSLRTVVLLLTDGYPDEDDCPDNSLEAVTRVAGRATQLSPAIPIYVFVTSTGLDFSAVAEAGGTDHTILADLGRTGVLSEAMQAIRERELASLPCDYPLPEAARAEDAVQHINLVHDGVPLPRVDGSSQCDSAKNAWFFDDPSAPQRALVCPAACAALQRGKTTIQLGCPSVLRRD